jgi:hypothetical protein
MTPRQKNHAHLLPRNLGGCSCPIFRPSDHPIIGVGGLRGYRCKNALCVAGFRSRVRGDGGGRSQSRRDRPKGSPEENRLGGTTGNAQIIVIIDTQQLIITAITIMLRLVVLRAQRATDSTSEISVILRAAGEPPTPRRKFLLRPCALARNCVF